MPFFRIALASVALGFIASVAYSQDMHDGVRKAPKNGTHLVMPPHLGAPQRIRLDDRRVLGELASLSNPGVDRAKLISSLSATIDQPHMRAKLSPEAELMALTGLNALRIAKAEEPLTLSILVFSDETSRIDLLTRLGFQPGLTASTEDRILYTIDLEAFAAKAAALRP